MRLSRKKKFVNEYNPFKEDIKQKYPELFDAIKQAVRQEISEQNILINDSFVAYIALHFWFPTKEKKIYEALEPSTFVQQGWV